MCDAACTMRSPAESTGNALGTTQGFFTYDFRSLQTERKRTSNHYKFTGKERDTETGLDYFGARFYGSTMGRFLSTDCRSPKLDRRTEIDFSTS